MVTDISKLDSTPLLYITRYVLDDACCTALCWITDVYQQARLLKLAKKHVRQRDVVLNLDLPYRLLDSVNITWCNNLVDNHWAETDGVTIELNRIKNWSYKELVVTLIHEALHGYVVTTEGHEIPEEKEHKIMCEFYSGLIS